MADSFQVLARLRDEFADALTRATTDRELQSVRDRFIGRKSGAITALWGEIAKAPAEQKRELGRQTNELKAAIEAAIGGRLAQLAESRPVAGAVDITLPGRAVHPGHRHPLNVLRDRIEAIFSRWGYEILDGPETEDDWHNFEALNM